MNIKQMISRSSLGLLTLCTFAVAPTFAQTITHVPLFTFEGDSSFDYFGSSVSGAGDVNGDGFDDMIVGAEFDDNNGDSSGSARVFSGLDGSLLYNFDGDSAYDHFGGSVSGAGDVNGDGFADLIVGAEYDDNNGDSSGSARVFSGSDGSVLYNFVGDAAGELFGRSVSGAGDVNGDGLDDLIVGARHDDTNGGSHGSARVFSGSDGSVLYNFDGDSADDFFGRSVSGAGDVNGDGFDDLIVGASGDENNGRLSGSARVFSGSDGSVLYNFDGDSKLARFGWSVSGAGDVNGDGFADLIVGASRRNNPLLDNGRDTGGAQVLSGSDGSVLYNFDGDLPGSRFGYSVDGAGDVNGDGFADLIVGAPTNGIGGGSAQVISGVDGSVLYDFDGDGLADQFGRSVSGVGDVNGDGLADFIVGNALFGWAALGPILPEKNAGYARVFVSQITYELGDCNQDGAVDFLDIPPFIAVLSSGGSQPEADINESGDVDFLDIGPFIEILSGS